SYFGHMMRNEGLEKTILLGISEGRRRRGRRLVKWLDEIESITGLAICDLRDVVGGGCSSWSSPEVVSDLTLQGDVI
ncbi:UNVERIFIED_CONTAM: hypothetical protein FKN15_033509, partial [Acipenser sinensis]